MYEINEDDGGWGVFEYYCCCKFGCLLGSIVCFMVCLVFGGGVCKDNVSFMKLVCFGSSFINGCICVLDNESMVVL